MAVLTLKSEEIKSFPPVLREYAGFMSSIKGNGEKTVCEYLLDLRTFFRFQKAKKYDLSTEPADFEKIKIVDIKEEDVKEITPSFIIDFLLYAGFDRSNSPNTRMRKLSALRSFFGWCCAKKHIIEVDPTANIDSPKKKQTLPKYIYACEARKEPRT